MAALNNLETAEFFRRHDGYLIVNHRRPDGDAVGSAVALCLGLRQMGKTACQLLLKSISGDSKIYRKIVPQKLVIRETSSRNTKL